MAQQQRAAATGGFDQARHGIDPAALPSAAAFLHLVEPHPGAGEVLCPPQQQRDRRIAIAARAAGFLVIGLDRFRHTRMGDEAHVGLVDSHAESHRGNHHHVFAGNECGLIGGAHLRVQSGVIGQDGPPGHERQLVRQFLHLAPGRGIDDAGAGLLGHQGGQLPHRIVAVADGIADIGPVEPGDDQAVVGNAQLGQHVGAGVGVCRGGQGQTRNLRKGIHQRTQRAVVRPEIMAPLGDAMRFVDGEEADRRAAQQFAEMALAGAFRRDVEQVQLARAEAGDGALAVFRIVGAGQAGGADTIGFGAAQLIVHQRDQRGDHHAGSRQGDGGQLIGQALARAGGHHRQRRLARHDPAHDLILHPAKGGEAEGIVQFLKEVRRSHASGLAAAAPQRKGAEPALSTIASSAAVKALRPRGASGATAVVK